MGILNVLVGDRVFVNNDTTLDLTTGGITLCTWMSVSDINSGNYTALGRKSGTGGYQLQTRNSGNLRYQYVFGTVNVNHTTGAVITANILHFLTAVHNIGTDVKIYVDGVEVLSAADTNTPIDSDASQNININGSGGSITAVDKTIGDARIYDRGLSAEEVKTLFIKQGGDKIIEGLRLRAPLNDYPADHVFTGSETFKEVVGNLLIEINNGNPSASVPLPLKAHAKRRDHEGSYL